MTAAIGGVILKRDHNVTALTSGGAGQGRIDNNNPSTIMCIVQLSVVTSPRQSSASCHCEITPPAGIVDTSYFAGTGDTTRGIYFLFPGDFLLLNWTGGPASGQGIATYVYIEVPT